MQAASDKQSILSPKHIRIGSFFGKKKKTFNKESCTEDKDYPSLAEVKTAFGSKELHPSAFKPAAQDSDDSDETLKS